MSESQQSDDTDDGESRHETPPAPETVLDDDRISYQAMETLSDAEYARLAADIRDRGVLQPVIIDEEDTILDGHHRAAIAEHYDLDASREPAYVVIGDLDTDDAKLARAIKQNLSGRDTTDGVKTHAVKQYIETAWDTTDDGALIRTEDDTEIADKLSVSQELVTDVFDCSIGTTIKHERLKAREYYEDNPDASYREVARQVDAANSTVTRWLKEDFEEGDEDDGTSLTAFATDESAAEKAQETFSEVSGSEGTDEESTTPDTVDDSVSEAAEENAERLARGETSPQTAAKNVEKAKAEQAVEEDRTATEEHQYTPTVQQADAGDWLQQNTGDVLLTDPPYSTDVDDVTEFAASWVPTALDALPADGYAYIFIGSYADEMAAYLNVLAETEYFVQPLVWNYRNTLGRSPDARYKRDWQAVLYCRGPEAGDLNAPKTSELRAVQRIKAPGMVGDDSERHHKWQKPRELLEQYISHTTSKGDTVIDPFAGSGEVLLTAADIGRRARGCDIDPDAVATAVERGCENE